MLKKTRKCIEYFFIFFVFFIPFISYLNTLRQTYGSRGFHIAYLSGGWLAGTLYTLYESTLGRLDNPVAIIDSLKGTFWSITFSSLHMSDPLAVLGHILTTREIYIPLLFSLLIPIIFTLIFGRAFCGWICPINTISELVDALRSRVKKFFPWIQDKNMGYTTKYWLFLYTMLLTALTGIPLFAYYQPYLVLGRAIHNLLFFKMASMGLYFLILLFLFEFFISRRAWCRYFCPTGAVISGIGSFSLVKLIKKKGASCLDSCKECDKICPMGLQVTDGKPGKECNQCGECTIVCPKNNLGFSASFSKIAALGFIIMTILSSLFLPDAEGNHMSGLPHYGYTENYPQVPLTEQKKESGDFVVSLTTVFFQGIKQELSNIPYDTQFFVHIYNPALRVSTAGKDFKNPFDPDNKNRAGHEHEHEEKGSSYRGRMLFTLMDRADKEIQTYSLNAPAEEAIYRFRHYFSRPGDYLIQVEFFPEGNKNTLQFPVPIKVAGRGIFRLIFAGLAATVIGYGIFFIYKKRKAI